MTHTPPEDQWKGNLPLENCYLLWVDFRLAAPQTVAHFIAPHDHMKRVVGSGLHPGCQNRRPDPSPMARYVKGEKIFLAVFLYFFLMFLLSMLNFA